MNDSRQDWLEFGNDFISNEIVKRAEVAAASGAASCLPYIQSYINGDFGILVWFWAIFGEGAPRECRAILYSHAWSCANTTRDTKTAIKIHAPHRGQYQSGSSMFVVVPEGVNDAKGVLVGSVGIPSVVRLQVLNQSLSGRREVIDAFKSRLCESVLVIRGPFADRKGDLRMSERTMNAGKLPDDAIQDGAQIMDTFARNDAEALRNLLRDPEMIRNAILSTLSIELGFYSKRATFKEVQGLSIELIDMLHCPIKPESGDFYTAHFNFSSAYDKFKGDLIDDTETKDSKGSGNPNSEAGRLLQESEESRHALSVPPSEEITSQTVLSRPRGDCTATHTRSNNPEGAS